MKTDIEIKATSRSSNRYENLESGNSNQKETKDEDQKHDNSITVKKFLHARKSFPWGWHVIFLISCVIGVLSDPLFLYIPIINEDDKCLRRDETIKNIALILRSTTDFAYILNMLFRLQSASKIARQLNSSLWTGFPWWYFLTDIFAILPLPQVVVVVFFSKMAGSKSLISSTLNILLLAQYVPRIIRIYIYAKGLIYHFDSLTRRLLLKVAFNFFLYIIAGHVFGAFWYFYSIFRETVCWHRACNNQNGCHSDGSFYCQSNSISTKNLTYFNQFCPVNPPNSTVYNFGIFVNAIESGTLRETNFLRKISMCFWWGLRNLSSLGSNLETSSEFLENLFAVLISMSGLLLFLSLLVGNLQIYLQLASTEAEKERQMLIAIEPEIRSYLSNYGLLNNKDAIIRSIPRMIRKGKVDLNALFFLLGEVERDMDHEQRLRFVKFVIKTVNAKKLEKDETFRSSQLLKWISDNGIPDDMKQEIMQHMRLRLQEVKDVDVVNILGFLPHYLARLVREHLCLDILKKVRPMNKSTSSMRYEIICRYLKPVTYSERTYIIRKGEPLDMMFFITQGIVWIFNETSMEGLRKGDYFGNEILEWKSKYSTSYSNFPISTKNVKAHTKVEAFVLMAASLEQVFNDFQWIFRWLNDDDEGLMNFLATRLQWRYRMRKKRKEEEQIYSGNWLN